jgi:hypothetical protein
MNEHDVDFRRESVETVLLAALFGDASLRDLAKTELKTRARDKSAGDILSNLCGLCLDVF